MSRFKFFFALRLLIFFQVQFFTSNRRNSNSIVKSREDINEEKPDRPLRSKAEFNSPRKKMLSFNSVFSHWIFYIRNIPSENVLEIQRVFIHLFFSLKHHRVFLKTVQYFFCLLAFTKLLKLSVGYVSGYLVLIRGLENKCGKIASA